jgi:hypothetical protein
LEKLTADGIAKERLNHGLAHCTKGLKGVVGKLAEMFEKKEVGDLRREQSKFSFNVQV